MRKQIFAWTGPTPMDGISVVQFLQVFHDTDGDKFTVSMRATDGLMCSVEGDRAMVNELTHLAIPYGWKTPTILGRQSMPCRCTEERS